MATLTNDGGSADGIVGTTTSHDHNGVNGQNSDVTARNAAVPEGNGVFGRTQVPDGAGIFGLHENNGVGVAGFGHPTGIGVTGISAPAGAKGGDGVLGISNSEHRNGIVGRNDSTIARSTADPGGNGIFGFTQVPDGAGVFGAHASTGIGVAGLGLIGVSGGSVNGVGVIGVSTPPDGTGAGDGVQGITNSASRNGVYGLNESVSSNGTSDPAGNGVLGFSNVSDGAGVFGAHGRGGHALYGTGGFGLTATGTVIGVWGIAKGSAWAGYFSGPVRVEGRSSLADVEVTGDVTVTGDIRLPDRDISERFEVESSSACSPGMVMIVGESGALTPCHRRYDQRAVGVISGAGTLRPAITLGVSAEARESVSIALVGTAYCFVDADLAPIEAGDFVTTSDTPGHGMKAVDRESSLGAVIGKALAPLRNGRGLVPLLLTLQ